MCFKVNVGIKFLREEKFMRIVTVNSSNYKQKTFKGTLPILKTEKQLAKYKNDIDSLGKIERKLYNGCIGGTIATIIIGGINAKVKSNILTSSMLVIGTGSILSLFSSFLAFSKKIKMKEIFNAASKALEKETVITHLNDVPNIRSQSRVISQRLKRINKD